MDGFEALMSAMHAKREELETATMAGLDKSAQAVMNSIAAELSSTAHSRGTPTPSGPGQPPSLVSGDLRRSIIVEGPRQSGAQFTATVAPTTVYARIQELGGNAGRGGSAHLPARPYVRPGVEKALPKIEQIMDDAWRTALE